jgi:CspA family cold shock protein
MMPRALKPKTIVDVTATREGSTYFLRIEDEAGKATLYELTALQTLRLADTMDEFLEAEEAEMRPLPSAPQVKVDGPEQLGTVKWFNTAKGFGFITPQGGGEELFVHRSVLEQAGISDLPEGAPVRVTIGDGKKGPTVTTIRRV